MTDSIPDQAAHRRLRYRMASAVLSALLSLTLGVATAQVPKPADRSSQPAKELSPREIVAALKQGGMVLYFRHATTDMSKNDQNMKSYEDCAGQRNLTDRGRDEARAVGRAIAAIGVPVGQVQASPYCRTMETARLMFGRAESTPEVRGGPAATDNEGRYAGLRRTFSTPLPGAENLIIASHGNPFYAVAGPPYLGEGELALVRPRGKDFEVIARVRPDSWNPLIEAARSN
jgi:phosphohistidine phosphatase SixA